MAKASTSTTAAKVGVLGEAENLIRGDRQKDYGHPKVNFQRIGDAWQAYLLERDLAERPLTPHDVASLMIILKAVRNAEGYKRDTAVDIGGYAALDAILEGDDEL
jgi:hypothetical protein